MIARSFCLLTFLGCALASFQSVYAQTTQSSDSDYVALKERVKQLEELVGRLEQKINQLEEASGRHAQEQTPAPSTLNQSPTAEAKSEPNPVQPSEPPVVSSGRDTFAISSRDKLFRLRIGGHLQVDGKTAYDNKAFYTSSLVDSFSTRRVRPSFEGSLGRYIDYRLMFDFGNGKVVLFDAYADLKLKPYAVLRAGKMKTPLGLERLQSNIDMTFVERSLVSDLIQNRDVGIQVYGTIAGRINYQAAVLNGATAGQNWDKDVNNGKDIVGRIFLTPLALSPGIFQGLGIGMAASSGRQEGAVLPTFITTGGQIPFFSYGSGSGSTAVVPTAAGRRLTYTPQLYYYVGPFGLMAEYVSSAQKISAVINHNPVPHNIRNDAWQVAGSWVLTGEKKSFKGVVPRRSLDDQKKGWGAWEVAARYTGLNVDPTAFSSRLADPALSAQSARAWAVGLHWYLSYFAKLQFNYEQTHFVRGYAGGDRPTEKVFEQRLQLAF
jgi:phosphate-selective porin OprO/OprP